MMKLGKKVRKNESCWCLEMPLKEKTDKFLIEEEQFKPQVESDYHDGTAYIDVVNQDPNLPYWFRQKHPFVFGDTNIANYFVEPDRIEFMLSISGARFDRRQHQGILISFKKKAAIELMQKIKESLDSEEEHKKMMEEIEKKFQGLYPVGYAFRKMFEEPFTIMDVVN